MPVTRVPEARPRVLYVTHMSPPSAMSAARRASGLARYLPDAGVDVTVLTSVAAGSGPVNGATTTLRTRDLIVSPLNWRRGSFQALAGESSGTYAPPSTLTSIIVPDLEVLGWAPFALTRALARRGRFDCVLTSAPPFSGHLVGYALSRSGSPWIADFRDGWTFESGRPAYPTTFQRRLDAGLERALIRRADAVVGVTPPITDDLVARFGLAGRTITNGFDPAECPARDDGWRSPLRADRHSLVYTGSLAYGGASPDVLVEALRTLRRTQHDAAERLELVVAGALGPGERRALGDPEIADGVRLLGSMPRREALRLQTAADSLLVVAGDRRSSVATGKLYEYLAARRPILVVGDRTVAAEIVRAQDAGPVVPADGGRPLVEALARLARDEVPAPTGDPSRFAYPLLAERYAQLIDEVIAARRAQRANQ